MFFKHVPNLDLRSSVRECARRSSFISLQFPERLGQELSLVVAQNISETAVPSIAADLLFQGAFPVFGVLQGVRNIKRSLSYFALANECNKQKNKIKNVLCGTDADLAANRATVRGRLLQKQGILKAKEGFWQIVGQLPGMSILSIPMIVACEVSFSVIEDGETLAYY